MTWPRPTTTRWSAVSCSSLIRWLETSTARPSAASDAQEAAHPDDALGVHAVERLVHHQHRRVAEQGRGDAEPLPHAERVAAGLAPRGRLRPACPMHLVDPAAPGPGSGPATAGGCGRCGSAAGRAASSSAPTWLSGCRSAGVGLAADQRGALVGRVQAEDDPHRGGLAGAVRADEAGDLAGGGPMNDMPSSASVEPNRLRSPVTSIVASMPATLGPGRGRGRHAAEPSSASLAWVTRPARVPRAGDAEDCPARGTRPARPAGTMNVSWRPDWRARLAMAAGTRRRSPARCWPAGRARPGRSPRRSLHAQPAVRGRPASAR